MPPWIEGGGTYDFKMVAYIISNQSETTRHKMAPRYKMATEYDGYYPIIYVM